MLNLQFSDVWQLLVGLVVTTLYASRVESRTSSNSNAIAAMERRIEHLETRTDNIESGLAKEISEVKQALARIEGYLKGRKESDAEHE